jgi:transposase
MPKTAKVTIPLDIPDIQVLQTEVNAQGDFVITIESTKGWCKCRLCGRKIEVFHGYEKWVVVRYLDVFGRPTYLHYRPKRYRCQDCEKHPTTTEKVSWHDADSPHTEDYDDHILLQLVNATVEDVSIKEGLSYDSVLGVLERRIACKVDWSTYTSLGVLGLDEIALKKGHRDFVVIVTAKLENGQIAILGVLDNRNKDTVIAFLRSIPEKLRWTIYTVCCDMYEGYTEAVRQELKQARITIDRFHVAEKYRDSADTLRKEEQKRLKKELPKDEYKTMKGILWAFRKNSTDLNDKERQTLQRLFSYSPKLALAYQLREQLTVIFGMHLSKVVAKCKIRDWIRQVKKSGLQCFDDFIKTLKNWWEEITNFFVDRANSGFVEGLNNKLKVLKRRCYGIFNVNNLFRRIYLDLEGYRLFC